MSWKETISKTYQERRPFVEAAQTKELKDRIGQQNKKRIEELKVQIEQGLANVEKLKQQAQALEQGTEVPIQQNKNQTFE